MAAQGQSFFNASGDSGSTMCYQATQGTGAAPTPSLSVIDPGSQPFATGVGGTFLGNADGTTPTDGSYAGEGVWNDGGADAHGDQAAGTGGGVSAAWTMPSYQSAAAAALGVVQANSSVRPCGGPALPPGARRVSGRRPRSGLRRVRHRPDGRRRLDDRRRDERVGAAVGRVHGAGQRLAARAVASPSGSRTRPSTPSPAARYAANFHDVTQRRTRINGRVEQRHLARVPTRPTRALCTRCSAGYDMATGLGSPIANAARQRRCARCARRCTRSRVAGPGNQLSVKGHALSLAVHATDSGNAGLTYSATGLPAGLSINAATGVISGTPSTTADRHRHRRAPRMQFANAGSASFTWTVVVPGKPQLTGAHRLSGLGKGRPRLTFTVAAGTFAPALKSVTITAARRAELRQEGQVADQGDHGQGRLQEGGVLTPRLTGGALTITLQSRGDRRIGDAGRPDDHDQHGRGSPRSASTRSGSCVISLKATDASHRTTRLRVTFKKPS